MEAVILAGGKGMRLRPLVDDVPKPAAPVGGVPFIAYPLALLARNGIKRVIVSVGYMREKIIELIGKSFEGMQIMYSEEETPLGTGGAIRRALSICAEKNVIVMNGDTFFDVDLAELNKFHVEKKADTTVALKEMMNFDRYGAVKCDGGLITAFHEKRQTERGYINGGIYCIRRNIFDSADLPENFSFEDDFLSRKIGDLKLCGLSFTGNFMDIGVPEDYLLARTLLPKWLVI
jgi:D-glycero-alpha-D-manno-heptose 1-phosphate guanylyltransferase